MPTFIVNIYALIIGMSRLVTKAVPGRSVDATTIRAARKVVGIILDFHANPELTNKAKTIFDQYVLVSLIFTCIHEFISNTPHALLCLQSFLLNLSCGNLYSSHLS